MNRRARQAALRIALLKEEFSPEELSEAISFLGGMSGEDLLDYLLHSPAKGKPKKDTPTRVTSATEARSENKALQALKSSNPQKYELLTDFEKQVRHGLLLPSATDIREFGQQLSRDFTSGKNRKDTIDKLISKLARMDSETVRFAVNQLMREKTGKGEPFQKLAEFIISGTAKPKS